MLFSCKYSKVIPLIVNHLEVIPEFDEISRAKGMKTLPPKEKTQDGTQIRAHDKRLERSVLLFKLIKGSSVEKLPSYGDLKMQRVQ